MKLQATQNRLILKENEDRTTEGGIVLADITKRPFLEATVLSIGPDVNEDVNEGDIVIFPRMTGIKIRVEGEDYVVIDDEHILGVKDES
jgi:chaperonin GroES